MKTLHLSIIAVLISKQKLEGNYNPSESVKKFDDWIISKNSIPTNKKQIDQRLDEIFGDSKYRSLINKLLDVIHESASYGNVPDELFDSDAKYWLQVADVASCGSDATCVSYLKDVFKQDSIREKQPQLPVSLNIFNFIMPDAHAVTNDYITSFSAYAKGNQCTWSNASPCTINLRSASGATVITGYGPLTLNYVPPFSDSHFYSSYLTVHAASYSLATSTVNISATVTLTNTYTGSTTSTGFAILDKTWIVGNSPTASLYPTISVTTNAYH